MQKVVTFPGLGLEFHLRPVLLPITDSFGIHWYGAIIAAGFLLAVFWCCRQSRKFGIRQEELLDMLIYALPLGIVGARLYYVLFEFGSYHVPGDLGATLVRIVRVWDGGLAIYGGIIAGILTAFVYCRLKKISFPALADVGCMGLLIGQCAGRWGNFVNVEAFGSVTGVPWRMAGADVAAYLSRTGQIGEAVRAQIVEGSLGVHPTFLYESLWNLAGFLILVLILEKRRKFDGELFLSYVAWYGLGRAWIEGLRTDSLCIPGTPVRVSQLLALLSALAAIGWIAYVLLRKKPEPEQLYVHRRPDPGAPEG